MNGRTALGAGFVLLAVLAGALFLDRAQRLVPVYAAARDLPAGTPLRSGDLTVVRVRLPDSALRHYLQPGPDRAVAGRVLTAPVRRETLVPAELALASQQADLVELPVQADPGDMAQGLRPGDRVQVLAAYTDGARRGRAVVLLPTAEVVRVLEDPAGLTGTGQERGVQLRMPSDRAPLVAAAIATARIFVVKAPGPPTGQAALPPPAPSDPQAPPPDTAQPGGPRPGTTQPGDDPLDSSPSDSSPSDTSTASPAEVKAVIR
jgi:pilus assembly protein CpaB